MGAFSHVAPGDGDGPDGYRNGYRRGDSDGGGGFNSYGDSYEYGDSGDGDGQSKPVRMQRPFMGNLHDFIAG